WLFGVLCHALSVATLVSPLSCSCSFFFFYCYGIHRCLLSFPTRRSSDLAIAFEIEGQPVHLAAIAKGSGMIHPNMGTMLSYIVTDLDLGQETLQQLLKESVNQSFNKISVDGDTSPNDTVLLASTNKVSIKPTKQNILIFQEKLTEICQMMAQEIVADGEGATKFVTVAVKGAASQADAEAIAKQVATSSL